MNYRTMRSYENVERYAFVGYGKYGIPRIEPTQFEECEFIGFNYAKSCGKPEEKGIHFFLDDYQFNRIWSLPERYLLLLKNFKFVLSPDFSTYIDFPIALQIYNHYRKHWLAAYWQLHGIQVIPTICWSDERSFAWCFDGEPTHAVVAVSSVGTQGNGRNKRSFLRGYEKMMEILQPKTILFYGKIPEECKGNIVRMKAFQERLPGR